MSDRFSLRIRLACVTTAILAAMGSPVAAQTVERVVREPIAEEAVLPGFLPGTWRVRAQLVWDSDARKLARRSYEIWDPLASQKLDLSWVSDDSTAAASGPVAGRGRIVWREVGAASYDRDAGVAHYRGEMRGGRAHGYGEFLHRAGAFYRGAWEDGLMHGSGRLVLPNGDEYVGEFRSGRRHGAGVYIDRRGVVYTGGFSAGLRDGEGLVVPVSGHPYRSLWNDGIEVAESRKLQPLDEFVPTQVQNLPDDGLLLGVSVDRRKVIGLNDIPPVMYVSERSGDGIRIFPDDQRLLDVWRGSAPINMTDEEADSVINRVVSFLGPAGRFEPVSILFDLENDTNEPVSVTGGFVDVRASATDSEPAVQLLNEVNSDQCMDGAQPRLALENYGWAAAQSLQFGLSFVDVLGQTVGSRIDRTLGTLEDKLEIGLDSDLASMGMDAAVLADPFCDRGSDECTKALRDEGAFGPFGEIVETAGLSLLLPAKGDVSYEWLDREGQRHSKKSTFQMSVLIGIYRFPAECGEGATADDIRLFPVELDVDKTAYRIDLPIAEDVPAGVTGSWRMLLKAPMSSTHEFRIVLQMADGREVASPPMGLLYFTPKPVNVEDENEEESADEEDADEE